MEQLEYLSISAGSEPLATMTGHIAATQGKLAALTPLMLGADTNAGKLVKWDGSAGKAVALTVAAVDATTAITTPVIKTGCINAAAVSWPDTVTTIEAKQAAFLGSPISIEEVQ